MLFKLLKYDLRAIYKYWWICAILSLGFSFVGGISFNILSFQIDLISQHLDALMLTCILLSALAGITVSIVGISAFLFATEIFIFIRFFKHFFTDEGYLTFTLPVKRSTLLNSKIISAFLLHLSAIAVILIGVCLFVIIGVPVTNLRMLANNLWESFSSLINGLGFFNSFILALELLVGGIITVISSNLSILICITFGSIIVKKGKVFAAIGIYYLGSSLLSGLSQALSMFAYTFLPGILMVMNAFESGITLWMILLPIIILFAAVTVAMYALELYMLDRKLNLA